MCAEPIREFTHFVGIEEENVLTSIANLGEDFFLIHNLDVLYMSCFNLNPIGNEIIKIPSFLYLITHSEFYFAMISFLRMHQSKSFISLRTAIDCTFTAYYLLKHPDKTDVYLSKLSKEENPEWNRIFFNIKRTIKENIKDFPLANGFSEIHEFCSIFAHSDALGILHRYNENKEKGLLEAKYFDYEAKIEDYNKWLAKLLFSFLKIYLIYWNEIFRNRARDKISEIEKRIKEYQDKLKIFNDKYPLGFSFSLE